MERAINSAPRISVFGRKDCMGTAKVKWFNDQKGYGFLACESSNADVFVHHSVIEGEGFKTLEDGETVEYEAENSPKGLKALRVRRLVVAARA
jgi:CspA family cold shock protein